MTYIFFTLPYTDYHAVMFNVIPSNDLFVDYLNVMHHCLDLFNTHLNIVVDLDGVSKIYAPHSGT